VLFLARGAVFFYSLIGARLLSWLPPDERSLMPEPEPAALNDRGTSLILGFYARIFLMQIAIIAGGFLAFFGSLGPLLVLIALKTVIDLAMHIAFDFGPDGTIKSATAR